MAQIFSISGGMNQDDSLVNPSDDMAGHNAFEAGDYLYALNLRDSYGDKQNVKGTQEITAYYVRSAGAWVSGTRPLGTEKVIGKYTNNEFRRVYYAVYNSNANHCIRYYDSATQRVYELLKWNGLNFSSTMFVKMAMIDNWLCLTDRVNAPRLMDVDTISDLYNSLTQEFPPVYNFREFHISFVKWAPLAPPILRRYYDGSTNNIEKFKNKALQFKCRYIYKGKLRSRWSPASVSAENIISSAGFPITAIELYIPGFFLDNPGANVQYNYFNHENVKFTAAVETIEIAYRENQLDVWRSYKTYTVQASGNQVFKFIGTSTGIPIADDDINQIFDTVPFLAGTVEAIDNRFVFGDCLNELTPAAVPIITNIGYVKWDYNTTVATYWNNGFATQAENAAVFTGLSAVNANELGQRNNLSDLTFKSRGIYKPGIIFQRHDGWVSGTYTNDDWFYEVPADTSSVKGEEIGLTFKLSPSFYPPSWAVAFQIVRSNCLNIDYFMIGIPNSFQPLIDSAQDTDKLVVDDSLRERVREHFENARLVTGLEYSKYLTTLGKKSYFDSLKQYIRKTEPATAISVASRIYIDINNWVNSSKASVNVDQPLNKLFYNFRDGDRIRFTASTVANPTPSQKVRYDVPILECTSRGIVIEKPVGVVWLPWSTDPGSLTDSMIEVYTPLVPLASNFIYYEVGEWYPILYPGHASRDFSKRDWTYTNNAAVTSNTYGDYIVFNKIPFNKGDCHFFLKTFYRDFAPSQFSAIPFGTCSMNQDPNETFGEWERGDGRPNIGYLTYPTQEFKTTQLRFGGKKVEESGFLNQLNRFEDANQKIYPSEYGRIRSLVNTSNAQVESVGAILLAIGEREAFSIYVNRTTLEDLSGRTQVSLSDQILGSYNTLLGSHGTFNPESVSVERGRVAYWDAVHGSWVRYGRDGLTAISDYKMTTWFKDLADILIPLYGSGENPLVISEYDRYNDELVTYINHSSLPSTFRTYATYKGVTFSEDQNKWKHAHNYTPEMFGKIDNTVISFRAGSVYLHEKTIVFNTFYGVKYDTFIEPVFNIKPNAVKAWQNMYVVATDGWSVERFLSEYRGTRTLQQASIPLTSFTQKEDVYMADIPKDVNTANVTNPGINGNSMRSKALRVLLKLDPAVATLSVLHFVEINPIDSPKNP